MILQAVRMAAVWAVAQAAVSLEHQELAQAPAPNERFNEYVVLPGHDMPNDYELPRPQDYVYVWPQPTAAKASQTKIVAHRT
jgi:hypothetical protein